MKKEIDNNSMWAAFRQELALQGELQVVAAIDNALNNLGFTIKETSTIIPIPLKQGEEESVTCPICGWEIEKQGEQKHADKVEPKFKVGNIIKHNKANIICKVISVNSGSYYIENIETSGRVELFNAEQSFHLWTIQDAKDGDVLCCESGWTCIFKAFNSDISFSSYCFMDSTGWFCETGSESHTLEKAFIKAYNGNIYPATKEQRDLLFQKMKEAGYEWDDERKELKKNEQKPAWSEEDEKILKDILVDVKFEGYDNDMLANSYKKINWLKSLRPQNMWKPSDEQMRVLDLAIRWGINRGTTEETTLVSLYNDLKKLKG